MFYYSHREKHDMVYIQLSSTESSRVLFETYSLDVVLTQEKPFAPTNKTV